MILRIGLAKGFAVIMALVLLCVGIYTVIKLRKQVNQSNFSERSKKTDQLKSQYDRGEITREEYEAGKNN